MDDAAAVQSRIDDALARGALVVVPSYRAAHGLRRTHLRLEQPKILSWRAWTTGMWHRALLTGATDRLLLNRSQEQALWRALIEQEPAVSSLRDAGSLARLAAEAWADLAQHRGLARLAGSATNADTETFTRLAAAFEQRCRREGFLPEARLESALRVTTLAGTRNEEENDLLLFGFDRLLPAQHALLDALKERGGAVEILRPPAPAGGGRLMEFAEEDDELRAAAAWCRGMLEEQPSSRIALVVPGLAEKHRAATIERVLREVLAPEAEPIATAAGSLPYEMVCGAALTETAFVAGALDLVTWATGPLPLDRVGALLLSPLLRGGERGARAEVDAFELRRAQVLRPEVEVDWMLKLLGRSARRQRLGGLIAGLRAMQTVARRHLAADERRPWGEWAEVVRDLLRAVEWGSEPASDAEDLAVRGAWESVLDELATLDFDGRRVGWDEVTATLQRLAAETMLGASFRDAPVQVMAPADAAGMTFDAVWFLRAGDLSWPVPVGGSPLLGWPLRRELGMPGAEPAADQAQARRVTERVAGSAGTVIFSYARELADGRQRASPVVDGLGLRAIIATPADVESGALVELEAVPDGSRIAPPPDRPIPGGAAVLRAQAACGFRAFAERRLFATGLEARGPGMNASERGIAVHRVLERFWDGVETQAALRRMSTEERDARLGESVALALRDVLDGGATVWDAAYLDTQRQRLMSLGRRWLEMEAARGVPFTVATREGERRDVAIGPLRLSLRIDRIDRTDQGAVLIDYKTGEAGPGDWLGERPDEPQLPLYAVLAGEPLHAIAFGAVRPGNKMTFTGYEDQPGTLTKPAKLMEESLEAQIEEWERVLTRLATDFWNGDTRVSPKEFPGTCTYCEQRLLCRLDAAAIAGDEEDGGDEYGEEELPG